MRGWHAHLLISAPPCKHAQTREGMRVQERANTHGASTWEGSGPGGRWYCVAFPESLREGWEVTKASLELEVGPMLEPGSWLLRTGLRQPEISIAFSAQSRSRAWWVSFYFKMWPIPGSPGPKQWLQKANKSIKSDVETPSSSNHQPIWSIYYTPNICSCFYLVWEAETEARMLRVIGLKSSRRGLEPGSFGLQRPRP